MLGLRRLKRVRDRAFKGMALAGFPIRSSDRQWYGLKNKHSGERAFIIGNGPSLLLKDLDRLSGEITFAANKVFLAFEKTRWRPTYYCAVDSLAPEFLGDFKGGGLGQINFFPDYLTGVEAPPSMYFRLRDDKDASPWPRFSRNPIAGIMQGYTVTYICTQLAFWMGIRELYLVGVDCNYTMPETKPVSKKGSIEVFAKTTEQNYFLPNYHSTGEKFCRPMVQEQVLAYESAKRAYEARGWRIRNATRGGALDVFERVDFDEVVET